MSVHIRSFVLKSYISIHAAALVRFPGPVSEQAADMEEASRVLTGLSAQPLTNSADAALVLTAVGGGLGGSRWVCAEAGAAGDVRSTNPDRSVSSWGTKGANQSDQSTEHAQWSSTGERGAVARQRQT